jgi:hypothetical protein
MTLSHSEFERKNEALRILSKLKAEIEASNVTTFHPFAELPLELRFKIWKLAMPGPRTVEMRLARAYTSYQYDFVTSEFPTVLHVCRESRLEDLKSFTLAFHSPRYSFPVYFNFQQDTLFIRIGNGHNNLESILELLPQKDKVQRLAIPADWRWMSIMGFARVEFLKTILHFLH